jgi:hypothetical protein
VVRQEACQARGVKPNLKVTWGGMTGVTWSVKHVVRHVTCKTRGVKPNLSVRQDGGQTLLMTYLMHEHKVRQACSSVPQSVDVIDGNSNLCKIDADSVLRN